MGFLKKLGKSLNPVRQTKQAISNPKQSVKETWLASADPAGYVARAGTDRLDDPLTARYIAGSAGGVAANPVMDQAAPKSTYTPGPMQLSPAAQKLYADMKARMAARAAGQNYTPPAGQGFAPTPSGGVQPIAQVGASPQMSTPLNAPKPQPMTTRPIDTPPAPAMPARAQSFKGLSGVPMADGGKVKGGSGSKVFMRKPNGKPY